MTKRTISLILAMLMFTGCSHKFDSTPEGGLNFREDLIIKEPVVLRNAYSEKGKIMYETLKESGYFPALHRSDDEVKAEIEFDIKLDNEHSTSSFPGKASAMLTLFTLGASPMHGNIKYTLNTGVWKNGSFINRYKPSLESPKTIVAWQIIEAEEKSLIKRLLPEMLRTVKADLAKTGKD